MKKIFLILVLTFLFFDYTYATSNENSSSWLTIKELSKNIEKLKDEKEKNKEKSKEYWELISFIRNDLSDDEIDEIEQKVEDFIEEKKNLEEELKQMIDNLEDTKIKKNDIIIQRANFYKYIAKYVQVEKRQDFITHIKLQIVSEKESKDLIEEIIKNQNILDKKVVYIKSKIETHKIDLQEKIEKKIISKIKQRLYEIDNNEEYAKITQKEKNKIYNNFIKQLQKKLVEIDDSDLSDNYKELRKNILNKLIDEITLKIKD